MSRATFIVIGALCAALVAAPAAAVDTPVDGTGIVHAGYRPSTAPSTDDVTAFSAALPKGATFVGLSMDATATLVDVGAQLEAVWAAGATPVVQLFVGSSTSASIAAGTPDPFLRSWADKVKAWMASGGRRSLIVVPLPEMNANGGRPYQCQPANYETAFDHLVSVIDGRLGASSSAVRWAFAPSTTTGAGCGSLGDYAPNALDFAAVSGRASNPSVVSPQTLLGGTLSTLKSLYASKPVLALDVAACPGAGRGAWITGLFDMLRDDRHVVGLVWFNASDGTCDWRVWDGSGADGAYAAESALARHDPAPIDGWFVADTTLVVPTPVPFADPCPAATTCDAYAVVRKGGPTFQQPLRIQLDAPRNSFIYGNPGDVPLMGDWNCDGIGTPGMFRQLDGFVYLRNSNSAGNADVQFFLGNPGDVPIAGDWNGDGCDTISIYRPSEQRFYIDLVYSGEPATIADFAFLFGNPGDKPFAGDLDGDGTDEVGLHRESTGLVYYRNTLTTGIADAQFIFGDPGDIVSAGDWNGNGTDTVAVYRPSNGTAYFKLANSQGVADVSVFVGVKMIGLAPAPRTPA